MPLETVSEEDEKPPANKNQNVIAQTSLTNQNPRGPSEDDWSELNTVIKEGTVTKIKEWFISRGLLTNARQFWSVNLYWPLQIAVRVGNLEIFETLVGFGFDPLEDTFFGEGLVHAAAGAGHTHMLQRLREHGLSLSVRDEDDNIPLHSASAQEVDNIEAITYLAKTANDINATNIFQETPLHVAVRRGSFQNVRMLVKLRADTNVVNCNDFSLLYSAINRQKDVFDVVTLLCSAGAVPKGPREFYAATRCRNTHVMNLFLERNFIISGWDGISTSSLANLACVPDPLERQRQIDVLFAAGYDVSGDIPWIRNLNCDRQKVKDVDTLKWQLEYYASNPLSLMNLSCLAIRRILGTSLPFTAAYLPLPEIMKDVVRFKHMLM